MLNIDFFKNLRREAYVHSIKDKIAGKTVAGVFGSINEALLMAHGIKSYPIVSIDGYIFEYGHVNEDCEAINSTKIYLETDKCPLLFSSAFIVHDGSCPVFVEKISKVTDKDFIYMDDLNDYLKENNFIFNEDLYNEAKNDLILINKKLKSLTMTNIDSQLLASIKFFIRFEPDLKERIKILSEALDTYKQTDIRRKKIKATCPYGIIDGIKEKNFDIIESTDGADYGPNRCAFCNKYINYEV